MNTDDDLPTLIRRKDHLNVLRYIRVHALRQPETVVEHGQALLGPKLDKKVGDEMARLSAIEQVCLAALDNDQPEIAEQCLSQLKTIGKDSTRFRMLLARCLEADKSYDDAEKIYDDLLQENPANLLARKRKYCIYKAQSVDNPEMMVKAVKLLNEYLDQNYSDAAAWYEMAQIRISMNDYAGAAFCLEEIVIFTPLDANIHVELAETYAVTGNLLLARKHMAQAVELDSKNKRALYGLATVSHAFNQEAVKKGSSGGGKGNNNKDANNEYEVEVSKELIKFASDKLLELYKGQKMYSTIKDKLSKYTDDL